MIAAFVITGVVLLGVAIIIVYDSLHKVIDKNDIGAVNRKIRGDLGRIAGVKR